MKRSIITLAAAAALCTACFPTRIVTTMPTAAQYSTVVTNPRTHTVTTTTQVYAADYDISLQLDLQAVAAAFAQSSTVRDFEALLNNSSYMISNLDLNEDGYVDYLRVLETIDSGVHVFLIQDVLAQGVYQDVATIVVEGASLADYCLEIIGDPYIYGANYIVHPTFLTRPSIFAHLTKAGYTAWASPWYWDHFPSYYKKPAPVYLNHYQEYVKTFMSKHNYFHEATYPKSSHYADYGRATKKMQHNDYGQQHPEKSFDNRNAARKDNGAVGQQKQGAQKGSAEPLKGGANGKGAVEQPKSGNSQKAAEPQKKQGSVEPSKGQGGNNQKGAVEQPKQGNSNQKVSEQQKQQSGNNQKAVEPQKQQTTFNARNVKEENDATKQTTTETLQRRSGSNTSTSQRNNTSTAGQQSNSSNGISRNNASTNNTMSKDSWSRNGNATQQSGSNKTTSAETISRVRNSGSASTHTTGSSSSSTRSAGSTGSNGSSSRNVRRR